MGMGSARRQHERADEVDRCRLAVVRFDGVRERKAVQRHQRLGSDRSEDSAATTIEPSSRDNHSRRRPVRIRRCGSIRRRSRSPTSARSATSRRGFCADRRFTAGTWGCSRTSASTVVMNIQFRIGDLQPVQPGELRHPGHHAGRQPDRRQQRQLRDDHEDRSGDGRSPAGAVRVEVQLLRRLRCATSSAERESKGSVQPPEGQPRQRPSESSRVERNIARVRGLGYADATRARAVARRDALRFQPWRRRQRCTARRRGPAPRQAGCAVAAEEARRRQRAPERWRNGAALGGVPGGRGHDGAADPRRSQGRHAQQLRHHSAGARRRKRQRRDHRSVVEGRRRSERRRACRRDTADARGAHRTGRRGEGAAERRRERSTRRKPGTDRRR